MARALTIPATVALLAALAGAARGELYMRPVLQVETGMHTAQIDALSVDAAGRFALTVSDDKTARLWRLDDGVLVQTLRVPIGPGNEGELYAGALSPDGRWAAMGGWTQGERAIGNWIYLFDRETGRLHRRLAGPADVVNALVFSPDGRHLAAVSWDGGLHLYRTTDWHRTGHATDCTEQSYGVTFAAGRLYQSCLDGRVRAFGLPSATLQVTSPPLGGQRPFRLAAGPGGRLAVGFQDRSRVELLASDTLRLLGQPVAPTGSEASDPSGNLADVAWHRDQLLAAGSWERDGRQALVTWADAGRGARREVPLADSTLVDPTPLPDGRLAWAAMTPAWGLLGRDHQPQYTRAAASLDLRGVQLAVDEHGSAVHLAGPLLAAPLRFDARHGTRAPAATEPTAGFAPPRLSAPELVVADWKNNLRPTLNGAALPLERHETAYGLSVAPAADGLALGTIWFVRAFDRRGRLRWQQPTPGPAWAAAHSGDGRFVIAALADGTLRWHRDTDGAIVLTVYLHPDGRWIAWTPTGYYDAAPGAEALLGWHVNRGPEQAADFYPAAQYRDRYFCPAMITAVLDYADEPAARAAVKASRACHRLAGDVLAERAQAPILDIIAPAAGAGFTGDTVPVEVAVRSPSGLPVTLEARVNGRQTRAALAGGWTAHDGQVVALPIAVPPQDVIITLQARTEYAISAPAVLELRHLGPAAPPVRKPDLYLLAIGVDAYAHPHWSDLRFPASDARRFARRWEHNPLYGRVVSKVLSGRDATKRNILDALEQLQRQATQHDIVVVYLAGHGLKSFFGGGYSFLPHDADPQHVKATWLAESEYRSTLSDLPAKVLLFLDTCYAAAGGGELVATRDATDLTGLINELAAAENGVVVYAASNGRQLAQESEAWGGGAFTTAITTCLAHSNRSDRAVTHQSLGVCIADEVRRLTGGTQHAIYQKPAHLPDFPIAVAE